MFRMRLTSLVVALAMLPTTAAPVQAAPSPLVLTDAIAAGVVRATDGFGLAGIVVPAGTYATYLVKTDPSLAGKVLQVWTRSVSGDWRQVTSRTVASDGTMRYFARVAAWTAFQARFAGDDTATAAVAHGRIANASAPGDASLSIGCGEFETQAAAGGTATLRRQVAVRAGAVLRVRLCSNASTGYRWDAPGFDGRFLSLLAHRTIAPTSGLMGAAGAEAWTFRALRAGASTLTLTYSRPWEGGEKATRSVILRMTVIG